MAPHCTVIIPTKNALPGFVRVLDAVQSQETPWPFDVLVIDSGSSDGTVEYVRQCPLVRLIEIEPQDFGHGKTRNQAIKASDSPFVAMLTHDATPVDRNWLRNLVRSVEQDDRIAGAFGRHIAYPNHSEFTHRELNTHFDGFLAHPLVVDKETDPEKYEKDIGWRQFLHFFSDNNSCLRRSVWETTPYPDVEFAEDQIWADTIIAEGYAKAYAPDAIVYHSHEYGVFERLQRSYDEANAFRQLFGYSLCANAAHGLKSVWSLFIRDFLYWKSCSKIRGQISPIAKRLLEDIMLVLGHYMGSHAESIPDTLRSVISRDKSIQKKSKIQVN